MKVLYMATSGVNDPTKASIPFHLAVNGSIEAGQEPAIALLGDAAEVIIGEAPNTLSGIGLPPLSELLAKVREHAVPVYV